VVYPGTERFPIGTDTEAVPLTLLCRLLSETTTA